MSFRTQLALAQLREAWMRKSTVMLVATAELGELCADVLLHSSKRLLGFSQARFMSYVAECRESYADEKSALHPVSEPEFEDPQHGATSPPEASVEPAAGGEPCWVCGRLGCTDIRGEHL